MKNFTKLLTAVAALTVIAAPVNASLRDNYNQAQNAESKRLHLCHVMKEKVTHAGNDSSNTHTLSTFGYLVDKENQVWQVIGNVKTCSFSYSGVIGKAVTVDEKLTEWHYEKGNLVKYTKSDDGKRTYRTEWEPFKLAGQNTNRNRVINYCRFNKLGNETRPAVLIRGMEKCVNETYGDYYRVR